jgi:opacity protein-like surface antigen
MTTQFWRAALCVSAGASLISSTAAQAATRTAWTLSTGATYSSGDYGDLTDTKVFAVPFALTLRTGNWKFRASLPWVSISGPALLIQTPGGSGPSGGGPGGGPGPSGGDAVGDDNGGSGSGSHDHTGQRSGIGDLNLAATYDLDLGHDFYLEPGVKLKIPTASRRKRIGTGKADVTVSTDLVKDVDRWSFYAGARRRFVGQPTGLNLRSTWGAGAGASIRATERVLVGADYDWQQSAVRGRGPSSEATAWASTPLVSSARLTLSATKGFTSNSARYAVAAIVSYRF